MNSKLMAIDLAKNVFQVCVIGVHGQVLSNRRISRHKLSELIANTPPTIIAMEACSSAHFWGRLAHKHGHEARLLPPQHVKAFRGVQKSDGHDALAIGEAAQRPKLHSVPVKDIQQQGNPPIFNRRQKWSHAAMASFCRGVMPPMAVLGRSLL